VTDLGTDVRLTQAPAMSQQRDIVAQMSNDQPALLVPGPLAGHGGTLKPERDAVTGGEKVRLTFTLDRPVPSDALVKLWVNDTLLADWGEVDVVDEGNFAGFPLGSRVPRETTDTVIREGGIDAVALLCTKSSGGTVRIYAIAYARTKAAVDDPTVPGDERAGEVLGRAETTITIRPL
jgi:hypothetical protein